MAAFRLFSKLNTFYGLTGQLLAGGSLKFYDAGTTTPRNVYGNAALSVNNGATVVLDSSGRPNVDVWGDGSYFVEAYDAPNVKQGDADNVQIAGSGSLAIPALQAGQFLTSNGAVYLWQSIREVPDPTGQNGKVLGTDGENLSWVAQTTPPAAATPANIAVTSTSFRAAGTTTPTTSYFVQIGSGSVAASGAHTASGSVTFPTAFLAAPKVMIQASGGGVTGDGYHPILSRTSISTTGFSVAANINESGTAGGTNISSAIAFDWIAFGTVTTP